MEPAFPVRVQGHELSRATPARGLELTPILAESAKAKADLIVRQNPAFAVREQGWWLEGAALSARALVNSNPLFPNPAERARDSES